jgi:hypothetical protein
MDHGGSIIELIRCARSGARAAPLYSIPDSEHFDPGVFGFNRDAKRLFFYSMDGALLA